MVWKVFRFSSILVCRWYYTSYWILSTKFNCCSWFSWSNKNAYKWTCERKVSKLDLRICRLLCWVRSLTYSSKYIKYYWNGFRIKKMRSWISLNSKNLLWKFKKRSLKILDKNRWGFKENWRTWNSCWLWW